MKENGRCLPLSKGAIWAATFTFVISSFKKTLNLQNILDFFLCYQLLIETDAEDFIMSHGIPHALETECDVITSFILIDLQLECGFFISKNVKRKGRS